MRPADIEDVDPLLLGDLDELDAVWRLYLPHTSRRLAARVRLELMRQAVVVHLPGPRLKRHFVQRREVAAEREDRHPDAFTAVRRAGDCHAPRRQPRRRHRLAGRWRGAGRTEVDAAAGAPLTALR